MSDPYKVLGLESNATTEEVKKAYKRLAMKLHPDRNGGRDEKFKELQTAYDQVKDGPPDFTAASFNFKTPGDINDFLREARFRHQMQVSLSMLISLKDAVLGGDHLMQIPVHGKNENVEITIPPGIRNGEAIRYPKLANNIDVVIKFRIQPDTIWEVQNLDLIKGEDISIWDLITGTELDVRTIDGSTIRLKVPPRTNPGTHMRVKGNGIQSRSNHLVKGDLLVRLVGKIPDDISESLLALIRKDKD